MRHCSTIEIHNVTERLGQTGSDISELYKGIVYRIGTFTVSKEHLCAACHPLHIKRSFGRGVLQLSDKAHRLLFATQNRAQCDFDGLKLAMNGRHRLDKIGGFCNREKGKGARGRTLEHLLNACAFAVGSLTT